MEHSQGIPKKKHKHKPVRDLMFTVVLLLCAAIINTLTVHAADINVDVEAIYADEETDRAGGTNIYLGTYPKGCGYKGQGVLIYLLEYDGGGAVAGTTPKAFTCTSEVGSIELHAQDKYNHYPEVTQWERDLSGKLIKISWASQVPNDGGFLTNSSTSFNTQAIKDWLQTETPTISGGKSTRGIQLVQTLWGTDIATRFADEEVILVAEPIVAITFSGYKYYNFYSRFGYRTFPYSMNTYSYTEMKENLEFIRDALWDADGKDKFPNTTGSTKLKAFLDFYIDEFERIDYNISRFPGMNPAGQIESTMSTLGQELTQYNFDRNGIRVYLPIKTVAGTPKYLSAELDTLSILISTWNASLPPSMSYAKTYKNYSGSTWYKRAANAASRVANPTRVCANANFILWPIGRDVRIYHSTDNMNTYAIGMLAMLAWHTDSGDDYDRQSTCDENLIPTEHAAPDESDGGCVIIKTYREKVNDSVTANKGTYYRYNIYNEIEIENEIKEGMDCYNVVEWRITNRLSTGDLNVYNWAGSVPGTVREHGSAPGTVILKESEGYKYLYVLLEKGTHEATSNYTLTESEITRSIRLSIPDVINADDNSMSNRISSFKFSWSRPAMDTSCTHYHNSGNCSTTAFTCSNRNDHSHCPTDCHYGKTKTTYTDHNNGCRSRVNAECNYPGCHYGDPKETYNDHDKDYPCYKCNGHSCSNYGWYDTSITLALQNSNKNNYPKVLATKSGWESIITGLTITNQWVTTVSFPSATISSGHSTSTYKNMDMIGVIHRGQDKLTLAQWKNEAASPLAITDLQGLSSEGYRVANTPLNETTTTRKSYRDYFKTIVADAASDLTVSVKAGNKAETQSDGCIKPKNYALSIPTGAPNAEIKATVNVKAYYGNPDIGCTIDESFDSSEMITSGSSGDIVKSGRMIKLDDSTVTTYPYIQMHYYYRNDVDTSGKRVETNKKVAYVLGEYKRSLKLNAYAEIQWKKPTSANVKLESLQWSTHASVRDDNFAFGEVLPGGATLNLTIPDANRQEVIIRTYNPILAGAGKAQVEATGGTVPDVLDIEKAKEEHANFVMSTIDGLSSLTFRQWYLPENITKRGEALAGNLWSNGGYEVWADMTTPIKTSKETKYYFTPITSATDGKLATEGDLDADVYNYTSSTPVGIKGQSDKVNAIYNNSNVIYATFWVDPKGSIRIKTGSNLTDVADTPKSNPYAGVEIAYRVGDTTAWVSSSSSIIATAREIDSKTYIVKKLTLAFEKGGGNDMTATTAGADLAWYNEAFDGITYAIVETKVMVGFADPGERSTVIDPVLCPTNNEGQTGMFSKYNTSQFKLMDKTNGYTERYKIGQYRGQDIKMNEFEYLFYSDKFWIPNVTVQDLK